MQKDSFEKAKVYIFNKNSSYSSLMSSDSSQPEKTKIYSSKSEKEEKTNRNIYLDNDFGSDDKITENSFSKKFYERKIAFFENQIKEMREKIAETESQNEDLTETISYLKKLSQKSKKHFENNIISLKQKLSDEKQINLTEKSKNRELKDENETLKQKIKQIEEKLNKKSENEKTEQISNENLLKLEFFNNFESFVTNQSQELSESFETRSKLSSLVSKLVKALDSVILASNELKELNDTLRSENNELKDKLKENSSKEISMVLDHLTNEETKEISANNSLSDHEKVIRMVETLLSNARSERTVEVPKKIVDRSKEEEMNKKYNNLYNFLENTLSFVKKIAKIESPDASIIVKQQCSRTAMFLEQNKPSSAEYRHESPFESTDINELSKIVEDFIGSEKSKESPFSEIVMLLDAMSTANAMLMENSDINKKRIQELSRNAKINKENAEKSKEVDYLKQRENMLYMLLEDVTNEDPIDWIENNLENILNENKILRNQLNISTRLVTEKDEEILRNEEEFEEKRNIFCKKAQSILNVVQKEFKKAKEEFAENLEKLKCEIKSAKDHESSKISQIETENKKVMNDMQKEIDYYVDYSKNLNSEISEVKENAKKELESEQKKFSDEKEDYENKINELVKVNRLLLKKQGKAKKKIAEINRTLTEMTMESNAAKPQKESVKELKEISDKAKEENAILSNKNEDLMKENEKLKYENAKMQIQTKTLKFKLDSLTAQLQRERDSVKSQIETVSSAIDSRYNESLRAKDEEIRTAKEFISVLANADKEEELSDLIKKARNEAEKDDVRNAGHEALKIRKEMQFDDNDTLYDIFLKQKEAIEEANKQMESSKAKEIKMMKDLSRAQKELQRCSNCTAEVKEWTSWARTMYMCVTNCGAPMYCSADLRLLLQESLLEGVGFGLLARKVDMLRAEKVALKSPVYKLAKSYTKDPDAKTALIVVIFAHRLLKLRGIMDTRYAPLSKKSNK